MEKGVFEFNLVVYPRRLWVAVGCSDEELRKVFKEYRPRTEDCYADVQHTHITENGDDFGGLLINFDEIESMTAGNIAHEATHTAFRIFEFVGAKVDVENPEPICYLIGAIAKCCSDALFNINNATVLPHGKVLYPFAD